MKAEKTPSYNNRMLRLTEIPGDALSELTITIEIKKPEPTANKPSPGAMGVTLDKYVIPAIIEAINKAHADKQRGKCGPLAALKTEAGTLVLPETFTYQELARAIIESGVSQEVIDDQIALGAYIHGMWGISLSLNHPSSQMVKVQEAIRDLRAAYSA